MKRTKPANNASPDQKIAVFEERVGVLLNRMQIANRMGWQYQGDRKIYEALGYPAEKALDFNYYWGKYERQDIASAVIDRPSDATWDGTISVVEKDGNAKDSALNKAWQDLNKTLKAKDRLNKLDKLTGIGRYGILLFGFADVKKREDWATPASGTKKLLYLRQLSESVMTIEKFETDSSNPRYGLPKLYKMTMLEQGGKGQTSESKTIIVHHSRVLHIVENNLDSEVYGMPRLKQIINRLVDLEKLLGGDAEMFWRGARPGYQAAAQPDYEIGQDAEEALQDELDKYEHDLRRFISVKGVDIKALEQQVADPLNHVDIQIQAIAAKTGIPKRVLLGSERGELSSSQDKDQWLSLVSTRMSEFAEPTILRPFIEKCMEHGILPKHPDYDIAWEDVFAPSDKEKSEVGEIRAKALKEYAASPYAAELLPPALAFKYLLGLTDDQVQEIEVMREEQGIEEEREARLIEEAIAEAERAAATAVPLRRGNSSPTPEETPLEPQ